MSDCILKWDERLETKGHVAPWPTNWVNSLMSVESSDSFLAPPNAYYTMLI